MIKNTKQIFIAKIDHPIESVNQILFKDDTFEQICKDDNFKIKKFIGSDWSIKDSGFIFYGPNELSVVFALINIEKTDFNRINKYSMTHLNGKEYKNKIDGLLSIIKDTTNNTTIIELRLEYYKNEDLFMLEKYIKLSSLKETIKKIFSNINFIFNGKINKNNEKIKINHSFIIKKNYKDTFNYFYNWNNMAKSIKTEKVWKIISEDKKEKDKKYKDFYIIINNNIKIHYHVISIEEIKNEKIEIVYNKTSNSIPSLNNYIKFSFYNIAKDICFFLYETHLPIYISSSIYETVAYYVYYCNKKTKNYIENNN